MRCLQRHAPGACDPLAHELGVGHGRDGIVASRDEQRGHGDGADLLAQVGRDMRAALLATTSRASRPPAWTPSHRPVSPPIEMPQKLARSMPRPSSRRSTSPPSASSVQPDAASPLPRGAVPARVVTQHAKPPRQRVRLRIPHGHGRARGIGQHQHGRVRRAFLAVGDPVGSGVQDRHRGVPVRLRSAHVRSGPRAVLRAGHAGRSRSRSSNTAHRPRARSAAGSSTLLTAGTRPSRVANAKSSHGYGSPSTLICVVSLRWPGAVTKKWMWAGRVPWRPAAAPAPAHGSARAWGRRRRAGHS